MIGFNGFSNLNGFNSLAQLITENGAISLVHNGHKFIRDRVENERSYWRCRKSFLFNCKARMVTKLMENGYEWVKVRNGTHDHTIKKIKKKGHKKSKLKQRNSSNLIRNTTAAKRLPPLAMPRKLPKLVPKPKLKVRNEEPKAEIIADAANDENVDKNYSPTVAGDIENDIVDILD